MRCLVAGWELASCSSEASRWTVFVVVVEVFHAWVFASDLKTWLRWSYCGSAVEKREDEDDRLEVFGWLWDFPEISGG